MIGSEFKQLMYELIKLNRNPGPFQQIFEAREKGPRSSDWTKIARAPVDIDVDESKSFCLESLNFIILRMF